MSQVKGIGSFGSTALLVSSMTVSIQNKDIACLKLLNWISYQGPGLSTIPPLFQQSGWLAPVFIFIIVAFLSGCSALFVCEALSNIKGNERFQSKVELTTIAQVYLGRKYHYVFQILLYLALQAVNVASIIIAAQTFDSMFITIFNGTCGLGVSPGGWFCVNHTNGLTGNSPFSSDDYFIFTFGFLLTAVLVIPLGFFSLVENIAIQMTSFIVLVAIIIQWCVAFCQEGLKTELLPASGSNSTMVLGIVIFNYSFITTIPSWVNSLKPNVNIHKCMWVSVIISTIFYLILGILGAMAFKMKPSSEILSILSSSGSTASIVTAYLFPVCALITSIPVFTIVVRSNLLRGEICSNSWAIFWSNFLPWFVCIPLQTKDYIGTIQNWSSLFFQSTVNFILPFILYFVSRKYEASVEPIISESEVHDTKMLSAIPSHLVSPSFALQHPGDNDVRMYNPEDNYSISIRRSSIKFSRTSQMENSIIVYSPNVDKAVVPTIVYSDITSMGDHKEVIHANSPDINPPTYSPNMLKAPDQQIQPSSTPSSYTAHSSQTSRNGLGISHPSYEEHKLGINKTSPNAMSSHSSLL
ncbi:hypothetical protein RO3G_03003 [Rhizopus delemar RA 99-880]|uniref:Amino acid transporter transmembrane domain-containing protein n=1 Tax=Rhizopus delemar (strain RA 99-880 / ATCC MYA-4621 / FGSC 9543 / NRRL 43880) TaxID=246409 RepID=I1BQ19_RHIO9|nr:hypothetical protein RO3G_03003 [Rhizopus delemar RA 99-880]|eukprot:EIE78299.1 hypothetical protein RO3G_03003 [Rhizopus delemar RA 99-880]